MALTDTYVVASPILQIVLALPDARLAADEKTAILAEYNSKFGAQHSNVTIPASELTTYDSVNELIGLWISPNLPYTPQTTQSSAGAQHIAADKEKVRRAEIHNILLGNWRNFDVMRFSMLVLDRLSAEDDATYANFQAELANASAHFEMISKAAQLGANLTVDANYEKVKAGAQWAPRDMILEADKATWNPAREHMKTRFYSKAANANANGQYAAVHETSIIMTGTYSAANGWPTYEAWVLG